MFSHAIVKTPGFSLHQGIASDHHNDVSYDTAIQQHQDYTASLQRCGLTISILPADDAFPDSTFIEDVAICNNDFAIITHPYPLSRRGETQGIDKVLAKWFDNIHHIESPGFLEGGDVLQVEDHYFIGITGRTNREGAEQFIEFINQYGYSGTFVKCSGLLHLKSGVSYLGNNTLLIVKSLSGMKVFDPFKKIIVADQEQHAANAIDVNNKVLFPKGYPITAKLLDKNGFSLIELAVSEFRKLDGGLSCLSLRF